jgi:N-acetylglucosaminyldiphosphoundecaprenol N-acetyl-beta-D-mannosaminyltransferase
MELRKENLSNFCDLSIFNNRKKNLLDLVEEDLKKKTNFSLIFTPNSEQIVEIAEKSELNRKLFQQANCLIPDSFGLVWASGIKYKKRKDLIFKERITGVDLARDLILLAEKHQYSCLLIGGYDYQNLNLNEWKVEKHKIFNDVYFLKNRHNKVGIYWWSGLINKRSMSEKEENKLKKILASIQPKIVFVALGFPEQEKFLVNYKEIFEKFGVNIGLAVGGAFDMIFGKIKRAPKFIQRIRLEWLWRLVSEPWRIKRQLKLFKFVYLVFKKRI